VSRISTILLRPVVTYRCFPSAAILVPIGRTSVLAYNLGNLWRRLVLPKRVDSWSLTSLQQRLVKTGGRLVTRSRYYWLRLAESHLTPRLFGSMLHRIWALPVPTG
jgi:hypothetical protein